MNTTDSTPTPPESSSTVLDDRQKSLVRLQMRNKAEPTLGILYAMGKNQADYDAGVGQWRDLTKLPKTLDCQGLCKGLCNLVGLKFPEGAQAQFNFTVAVKEPKIGDFGFMAHGGDITKVYHIGMIYDEYFMIEARGHQENCNFETGKVILRPRKNWEAFLNYGALKDGFVGYRAHPKLA